MSRAVYAPYDGHYRYTVAEKHGNVAGARYGKTCGYHVGGRQLISQKSADYLTCTVGDCEGGDDDGKLGFGHVHVRTYFYQHCRKINAHYVTRKIHHRTHDGDKPCVFDDEGYKAAFPKMKELIEKIKQRLNEINDGSFTVEDYITNQKFD